MFPAVRCFPQISQINEDECSSFGWAEVKQAQRNRESTKFKKQVLKMKAGALALALSFIDVVCR